MAATKTRAVKRANGKYTALYLAPDGNWLSAGTYGDKAVAKIKAQMAYDESRKTEWVNPKGSKTLLANYARDVWFPSLLVEATTRAGYDSDYRCHILPVFGHREMGSILYTEVQTWLNNMEEEGIGRSTQRKAYVVLNMILKAAKRDRLITSLATEGIKTRPITSPEVKIFHRHHWEKFLAEVPNSWKPLMIVGVETGMRPSELRALCPAQVDWSRQRICVSRATVTISNKSGFGRFVDKNYPKGKRSRTIKVERTVLKQLATLMLARGLTQDSEERLFLSETGKPLAEEVSDMMRAACTAADVPVRTFKHLRSTKASWMLQDTRDLMAVKDYLGHADITTTQKYLATVEDDDEVDNVISFEDYLDDELKEAK